MNPSGTRSCDATEPTIAAPVGLLLATMGGTTYPPPVARCTATLVFPRNGQNPHGGVVSDGRFWEEPMAERPELLGLATEIISAQVSHNAVAPEELPGLIQQVFNALATVGQATAASPKAEPPVPVKKSVLANHIVCLDCGKHFSMLKRHLMTDHKLTPERSRQRWELPQSYPLVAPDYELVGAWASTRGCRPPSADRRAYQVPVVPLHCCPAAVRPRRKIVNRLRRWHRRTGTRVAAALSVSVACRSNSRSSRYIEVPCAVALM